MHFLFRLSRVRLARRVLHVATRFVHEEDQRLLPARLLLASKFLVGSARVRRRLPLVPSPTVALEPEQQVGSAVAPTGYPPRWFCSNGADSARPRGINLGSKGIQVSIEHCRRRQSHSLPKVGFGYSVTGPIVGYCRVRIRHVRREL